MSKSSAIMLSELEKALENLVDVYHNYSLVKGNKHALYKDDFQKLVTTECPHYMEVRRCCILGVL